MKRAFQKLLRGFMCLSFTLFSFVVMGELVGGQQVYADADVEKTLNLGISYNPLGVNNEPSSYNVSYILYSGDSPATGQYQSSGSVARTEILKNFTITVPADHSGYKVKIMVQSSGIDVYRMDSSNPTLDNSWKSGKMIDIDSLENAYIFVIMDNATSSSNQGQSVSNEDHDDNSELANAPIITPDGKVIESWDDVETDIETNASSYKDEPVQIVINKSTELPKSVFESITHTQSTGLHAFMGGGSAITFLNDNKLKSQEAVDLSCTVLEEGNKKTIKFNSEDKLKASVLLHSVVPIGTNFVYIYRIEADGTKKIVGSTIPTAEGRFCFAISQLGQYEIDY
ncbi:MAG: hypothetical protein II740_08915 [Lachnospiraceae bacterium]|nr:hypothetical protein [Lachnospiraceae bacterium]